MESRGIKAAKAVLQSDELTSYILETSVYPREPAPLKAEHEKLESQLESQFTYHLAQLKAEHEKLESQLGQYFQMLRQLNP